MAALRRYLVAAVVLLFLGWAVFTYVRSLFDEHSVLRRAIEVHGGEKRLMAPLTGTIQGTGVANQFGQTIPCTWQEWFDGPHCFRFATRPTAQPDSVVFLLPANEWWTVSPTGQATRGQGSFGRPESQVGPLRDLVEIYREVRKLTFLPDAEVAFRTATVIEVDLADGKKDSDGKKVLYFDQSSGLLVKFKTQIQGHHGDTVLERYYSDHKDFNGIRLPMTVVEHRGGKPYSELKLTEVRLGEPVDPETFAKP